MRVRELKSLVESTADCAFAIDGLGLISAWNAAAEATFGRTAAEVIGKPCGEVLQGMDECGPVCSPECVILKSVQKHRPVGAFDLLIDTPQGKKWFDVSVLIAEDDTSTAPTSVHIVRPADTRKRLELLVRDIVSAENKTATDGAAGITPTSHSPARDTELTRREVEVLRLLARGTTTTAIAEQLKVSRTTVNNHIQHIFKKLNAHTRLEAIRRAEFAGLI